ncbi:hypothetical protein CHINAEXTREME_14090 [Halobiforma lacisalsi AJ5]|uniref:Uncharacterized protein n=1 Tax=Natronobacterium lacisalsi AJ5 TaxID=358396 RepID=M0LK03_NATLA|nr:hypothetical protein [Halobiforma lacisalsi]APW98845.1 hypothetical protein CHINAEXTREME_14090 [Halobiforma lacisalsi AJ5]EMA32340.1 hypothetical protein C445_11432 [Halobiforma lacisalsi AJ5]
MKRALTITLTIALMASVLAMGFAGTAAAYHEDSGAAETLAGVDGGDSIAVSIAFADATTNQVQNAQQNNVADVNQSATSGDVTGVSVTVDVDDLE